MKVAIVYDSRTGNTAAAADKLAERFRKRGDDVTLQKVDQADPVQSGWADLLCVGSWTQGLFVVGQRPTAATMAFIEKLPPMGAKRAVVFCSYAFRPGKTLDRMAHALEAKGAHVDARIAFRGREPAAGFDAFVGSLRS